MCSPVGAFIGPKHQSKIIIHPNRRFPTERPNVAGLPIVAAFPSHNPGGDFKDYICRLILIERRRGLEEM